MFRETSASVIRPRRHRLAARAVGVSAALLGGAAALGLLCPSEASAQIKHPGAHPAYAVELEPHLLIQWNDGPWDDEGFGPGIRVNIPFLDNGPVRTINNNMAIGVGLDVAFFDDCDNWWWRDRYTYIGEDCSATDWWFPGVVQWNFFLTPVVSVFGELGLAFEYERESWEGPCPSGGGICDYDDSDLDLEPLFWGGGRFLLGDTVSIIARLGTPYISVGVGILL